MKACSFEEALMEVYLENPCRTQATALWKTLAAMKQYTADYRFVNEEIIHLGLYNEDVLHTFWNRYGSGIQMDSARFDEFKLVVIHASQITDIGFDHFSHVERYFRLIHHHHTSESKIQENYYVKEVNLPSEIPMVSDLICRCYTDIKPSAEKVLEWTTHEVFDPNLWVWMMDKNDSLPVGLGIAEFDASINEGSIEWLQVLPSHRNRGLGKALVNELINRLRPKAHFTTVSGKLDNESAPEKLYRSCGFEGNDIWYVLRKKDIK